MTAVPLRLGIVGCGWISDWHGRAAARVPDVKMVACCDVRADVAEAWGERHGCERAYADHLTMLREHALDGIVLTTWPSDHRDQILSCFEAGVVNILCEKSLAVSCDEAIDIWTAARDARGLVVEGFMYRHHPAIRRTDELVAKGDIGAIDNVTACHDLFDPEDVAPDDPARNWRQRKDLHGGVPYDVLCYCVNACNHYAGALPARALAVTRMSERYGTVARAYGLIEYENGVVGSVSSSRKSNFNYELKISGETGQIVIPVPWSPDRIPPRHAPEADDASEVLLHRRIAPFAYDTERIRVPAADPYHCQMADFAAAVRGHVRPTPSLAESVVNVLTINALLASGREGSAVAVELPQAVQAEAMAADDAGARPS